MKNPNGFGSVRKHKDGRRRRPYGAYVSVYEMQPNGIEKRKQKSIGYFATKQEATKALLEYNDNPFDVSLKNITFGEIYARYILPDLETAPASTKNSYSQGYKRCSPIDGMKIKEIKPSHIKTLLEQNKHFSKSSLVAMLVVMNKVFDLCVLEGLILRNPARGIKVTSTKKTAEKKSFTREEVQLIRDNLDYVVNPESGSAIQREALMDTLLILIYTGMRIEEFLNLKTEDIHLDERWIQVNGTKTKNSNRIVPIHKEIIPLIEKRMNGTYLLEVAGKPVSYVMYRKFFFAIAREHFGLDHTLHETRHTFSTFTAICDFKFAIRQKILGHRSKSITDDVYTHIFIQELVEEIDKLVI